MSAAGLLLELRARNIAVDAVDGHIRCRHRPGALPEELAARVRARREEVLALLADPEALREAAARAIFAAVADGEEAAPDGAGGGRAGPLLRLRRCPVRPGRGVPGLPPPARRRRRGARPMSRSPLAVPQPGVPRPARGGPRAADGRRRVGARPGRRVLPRLPRHSAGRRRVPGVWSRAGVPGRCGHLAACPERARASDRVRPTVGLPRWVVQLAALLDVGTEANRLEVVKAGLEHDPDAVWTASTDPRRAS